jgi:hypothetical protein
VNHPIFLQFKKITVRDSVVMPLFREHGIKMYLFENGSDSLNSLLTAEVSRLKGKFRR